MSLAFKSRSLTSVNSASKNLQWGGYSQAISAAKEDFDPFIYLSYRKHSLSPGQVVGFGPHPHRGFETVTYQIEGITDHGDSEGHSGRYSTGDVQWMSAGKGIYHSEMFIGNRTEPSNFEAVQLWVNLPKNLKMSEPHYQMLWSKDIPLLQLNHGFETDDCKVENSAMSIKVIAGSIGNTKSPAQTSAPQTYFHVKMEPKCHWTLRVNPDHHALIFVIQGSGQFGPDNRQMKSGQWSLLNKDGNQIEVRNDGKETLNLLYLAGQPFKEPIFQQGPFVMNSPKELQQAAMDFQTGKFGDLRQPYFQEDWEREAYES